jgi:hypothetical protein
MVICMPSADDVADLGLHFARILAPVSVYLPARAGDLAPAGDVDEITSPRHATEPDASTATSTLGTSSLESMTFSQHSSPADAGPTPQASRGNTPHRASAPHSDANAV